MSDRDRLLDKGRALYDQTVARGVDQGRYRLIVDPTGTRPTMLVAGALFDQVPPTSWAEEQIDQQIKESGR
ncbi:hypothetical protein [Tomitella fengzijianii]|uniref:Uncharacterized protein n=1 Tax=Tomitella fengzijianii TaxID=2597660 RepID=A0A516X4V7_9ACTN|nr:hypothetical protein [Tomitella fengzijianii]QDQ98109.1 hypothetical protein FO059_13295 [Tomitella fengzijianii]